MLFYLLLACGSDPPPAPPSETDGEPNTPVETAEPTDSTEATTGSTSTGDDTALTDPCATELTAPIAPIRPQPGELYYVQLGLGGPFLGEAAVVVGPDGTVVVIDAGNDAHDDDVQAVLSELADEMVDAGFTGVDAGTVDHVLITHLHADHADGLEDLLQDVGVDGLVVHRGLVDLTEAANPATVAQLCRAVQNQPQALLCEGPALASCEEGTWTGTNPSTGCEGLDAGDLTRAGDAGTAFLPLGDATLSILGANGHMAGDAFQDEVGPLRTDDLNGENARSLVGVLSHGPFRLLFAGDLTTGTSDSDPVEEFYVPRIDAYLDARGVDVLHLSHHGRDSSSSSVWLDRLLPADGLRRHGLIGVSTAHLGSPHQQVLDAASADGRLGGGSVWTTTIAPGGADDPALINAQGGRIVLSTVDGGNAYAIQALSPAGDVLESTGTHAAAACR